MNGAEHYDHAQTLLKPPAGHTRLTGQPSSIEAAKVHALLAIAAALGVNQPQPEPDEDSDGWELMMPGMISRNKPGAHWPPRRGDLWQDQRMRTWLAVPTSYTTRITPVPPVDRLTYLVCLDHLADDSPDEVRETCGPLTLVFRPSLLADCPF